ncbi:hypothetical protein [Vibrio mediterranei]|uniref:hypothetical protein n=1 Tax=Vibrio mediterranei TaxID=689 RepID=UPI00148C7FE1|nr:hypothetical protein [Vibrio mediterranei]NOI26805.1 hypothetical protein [Vibrio mediterranei]
MSLKDKVRHLFSEMFIAPKNQRAQDYHHIAPKIAPLVSALNQLPGVETIASCQGHACGRIEAPYVYFKADNDIVTGIMTLLRQHYQRGELHHSWELTGMFNHQSELCWSLSSPYYYRRFAASSVITLGWHRDKVDHDLQTLTQLISEVDPVTTKISYPLWHEETGLDDGETRCSASSELGPMGFTYTNDNLHAFAGQVVAKAKDMFQAHPIYCRLWAFRHDEYEMLSCDLFCDDDSLHMPITITACQHQQLHHLDEPDVQDMTEAFHLASIIICALEAQIEIGRHHNEINKHVLARPLKGKETNGDIHLWKNTASTST